VHRAAAQDDDWLPKSTLPSPQRRPREQPFDAADGTTDHVGAHVGILRRGKDAQVNAAERVRPQPVMGRLDVVVDNRFRDAGIGEGPTNQQAISSVVLERISPLVGS